MDKDKLSKLRDKYDDLMERLYRLSTNPDGKINHYWIKHHNHLATLLGYL